MACGSTGVSSSGKSRWRPTPEQVMVLQELFMRRGVKTPTAQQIQRITQQLKHFGKVEIKNVFYWFQNHKAREKQKLKKRLLNCYVYIHQQQHHRQHGEVNGGSKETSRLQQLPNVLYFLPPQQPSQANGFWPFIPAAQVTRESNNNVEALAENADATTSEIWSGNSTDEKPCKGVDAASEHHHYHHHGDDPISSGGEWGITWTKDAVLDSISSTRPSLETLQLFPTSTITKNPTVHGAAATAAFNLPSLSLSVSS